MIAGRLVGCACDTEPERTPESTAIRDGDELVVNGRKLYVVNGANADLCFVTLSSTARWRPCWWRTSAPASACSRSSTSSGRASIDSAMIEFDRVRVPAANLSRRSAVSVS